MFNKEKVKLGIAPIAWTNDDLPDLGKENTFEQCVSEMALAGFTGSEVGNKYPKDPEVLKKALELRGIEICNQWFSSFLITKPFEEVEKDFRAQLSFLKAMGAKVIGASEQSHSVQGMTDTPIFGHKYVMNDEEWETFCTGMNKLGKIAKGDGCIDFDPIFKVLEDAGYEGYMLVEAEQDPAKANPLEYALKARKFIAEKTGL